MIEHNELKSSLRDAFKLARIERTRSGISQSLEVVRFLIQKRQFDSAELTLDMAIRQAKGNNSDLVNLLLGKADLAIARGDLARATSYIERASALAESPAPLVLMKEGKIADLKRDWRSALEKYLKAATVYRTQNKPTAEGEAILAAGQMSFKLMEFAKSLQYFRAAAKHAANNTTLHLRTRMEELSALTALHRSDEALDLCDRLEDEIKGYPFSHQAIEALLSLVEEKRAVNLLNKGKITEAHAIRVGQHRRAPTAQQKAVLSAELALAEFSRGRPDAAKAYEEQAFLFSRGSDGIPEMLLALSRLNLIRDSLNTADQQLFDATLELPDAIGRFERIPYDIHKAQLLIEKGEIEAATTLTDRLYVLYAKFNWPLSVLATILNVTGQLSLLKGETDQAITQYERSLQIANRINSPVQRAVALSGLASAHAAHSDYQQAANCVEEAVTIVRNLGELKLLEHSLLLQREEILVRAGSQTAEAAFGRIGDLLTSGYRFDSSPLDIRAMVSLSLLAWHELDKREEALSYLKEASDIAETAGLVLRGLFTKGLLGSLLHDLGEDAQAEELMIEVVSQLDKLDLQLPAADSFRELYRYLTGFPF